MFCHLLVLAHCRITKLDICNHSLIIIMGMYITVEPCYNHLRINLHFKMEMYVDTITFLLEFLRASNMNLASVDHFAKIKSENLN